MKTNFILLLILSITVGLFFPVKLASSQSLDDMVSKAEILEKGDKTDLETDYNIDFSDDSASEIRSKADTTSISLGRRQIRIIEINGNTNVSILDRDNDTEEKKQIRRSPGFKGNWRGLEMGLNNYVNSSFSTSLDPADDFMELRTGKSWNINLNILQYDFALSGNNFGLVTGLGFEFNDYRFSNNTNIMKHNREIVAIGYDELGINLDKTKLSTVYITVPLMMEFQTRHPRLSRRVYFSAGVIGGINIGSHSKIVYQDNSRKKKDKVRDDFYLSPFRYGFSFRTGYRSLNLFANYYPTPLFQKNKGPELYPVSVGFSILGF